MYLCNCHSYIVCMSSSLSRRQYHRSGNQVSSYSNQTNLFRFTANCARDVLALERLLFPFQITKLKSLKHHSFAIIFLIASCFLQKTFLKFFHHSKQKNSSFKVTSLPVGQTIKLISQTFEHRVKFCISQMSFQIAPIYITWQSIIGCHQQM